MGGGGGGAFVIVAVVCVYCSLSACGTARDPPCPDFTMSGARSLCCW